MGSWLLPLLFKATLPLPSSSSSSSSRSSDNDSVAYHPSSVTVLVHRLLQVVTDHQHRHTPSPSLSTLTHLIHSIGCCCRWWWWPARPLPRASTTPTSCCSDPPSRSLFPWTLWPPGRCCSRSSRSWPSAVLRCCGARWPPRPIPVYHPLARLTSPCLALACCDDRRFLLWTRCWLWSTVGMHPSR